MFRTALKILAADVVLLAAEFYVIQDLRWRSSFAGTLGYSPSFSYNVLTQFFTMARSGSISLTSPLTLDWVQTLAYALVLLNGWFAYRTLKSRGSKGLSAGASTPQKP